MKFISSLTTLAIMAVSASNVLASPSIYDMETLPNGISLPRAGVHHLSDARRRDLIDGYFNEHPEERAAHTPVVRRKKRSCKSKAKTTITQTSSKAVSNDASKPVDGTSVVAAGKGLFGLKFGGACPNSGADDAHPNGALSFLNCGISKSNPSSKWNPPVVKLSQLRTISAAAAAKSNVFKPCAKYKSIFENASKATGIPAVMLMSFAIQESTCNPSVRGGNGEIGMMQLTPDKCKGINCWDAQTNVNRAATYFKQELDNANGNILQATGAYNGWQKSMSYSSATSQRWGCHAQNNLDYLNQMFNALVLGKDPSTKLVYNNLARCG